MQDNNSIEIFLPNIPNPLIIDIEDLHHFQRFKDWKYDKTNNLLRKCENYKTFTLHRMIMNPSNDTVVDHINNNRMDNRRCNLRICHTEHNAKNKSKTKTKTSSKYKGVSYRNRRAPWQVSLMVNGRSIYVGCFMTEEDAARAYDKVAKYHHGKFANLNFN